MGNYRQPKYETWETLKDMGADVIGSYLLSENKEVIKEMCLHAPDKMGKIVYEGDIVARLMIYTNPQGEKLQKEELHCIRWLGFGFYFNPVNTDTFYGISAAALKESVIVGNVHQLLLKEVVQN
jgi:hypothetical protein